MEKELAFLQNIYNVVSEFVITYSFQILGALIILAVGFKVASWLGSVVEKFGERKNLDVTLTRFMAGGAKLITIVFVLIIALGKFGISIAPFIAALGALAFGGSFAIQGPLSNYGAGLSIILSRHFVVGDTLEVKGRSGVVEAIHLAATILTTEDGEKITIPNKHIVGEILTNSFANKIVEGSVGISYGDDPERAVAAIRAVLGREEQVSNEPAPQVGIEEFGDSSINIGLRYWVPTIRYFETSFRVNLAVYRALQEAGLTIPFPQREVRLLDRAEEGA